MVPVDRRFRPGHCRPGWCGLGDGRPSLDCGSGQASRRRVSSSLASGAQVSGEVDADGCFLSTERELRWRNAARLQNVQRVLRCDGVLGDAADLSLLRSTLGACIYGACVFSPRSAALATVDAACRLCGVLTAMTEQQELRYPGRVGCICGVLALPYPAQLTPGACMRGGASMVCFFERRVLRWWRASEATIIAQGGCAQIATTEQQRLRYLERVSCSCAMPELPRPAMQVPGARMGVAGRSDQC